MTTKRKSNDNSSKSKYILALGLIASLGILGIVILIGGNLPISNGWLKQRGEKIFLNAALDTCTIDKVTLTLFQDISLTDIKLKKKITEHKTLFMNIPNIYIDYYPVKTFSRWSRSKKILTDRSNRITYIKNAQRTDMNMVSSEKSELLPALYTEISGADTLLFTCIDSLALDNLILTIDSAGTTIFTLTDFSLHISFHQDDPQQFTLDLSVAQFHYYAIPFTGLQASLVFNGPLVELKLINGSLVNGTMSGNFNLDLPENKIRNGYLNLQNILLQDIFNLYQLSKGNFTGICNLRINLDSSQASFRHLNGRGSVRMKQVEVANLTLLRQIVRFTQIKGLSHLKFDQVSGDFTIEQGKIHSKNLHAQGSPLVIDLNGWIAPEMQTLALQLKGTFVSSYKDSVNSFVWNTLIPEPQGNRSFACTVNGSFYSPDISFDKKYAQRAINSLLNQVGQELKSLFNFK